MTTAYCDYPFYRDTFLGNKISETDFPRLALRASAVVDQVTFQRSKSVVDLDAIESIKMATCSVAEVIQTVEQEGDIDGVSSETTGRHSITYNTNSSKQMTKSDRYQDAARLYLGETGLMFAGFKEDELG